MGTFLALDDLGVGLGSVIMGIVLRLTNYPVMFLSLAFTGLINLSLLDEKSRRPIIIFFSLSNSWYFF